MRQARLREIITERATEEKASKQSKKTDHFPIFCSFVNNDTFSLVSGVWKFNNSLLFNTDLINDTHREKLRFIQFSTKWLVGCF